MFILARALCHALMSTALAEDKYQRRSAPGRSGRGKAWGKGFLAKGSRTLRWVGMSPSPPGCPGVDCLALGGTRTPSPFPQPFGPARGVGLAALDQPKNDGTTPLLVAAREGQEAAASKARLRVEGTATPLPGGRWVPPMLCPLQRDAMVGAGVWKNVFESLQKFHSFTPRPRQKPYDRPQMFQNPSVRWVCENLPLVYK